MGSLTIVIGGVRSGKTRFSEQLAIRHHNKTAAPLVYVASGVAFDNEMKERIARHRDDRKEANWTTIEQPTSIAKSLDQCAVPSVIVWDCLTTWLTNELFHSTPEQEIETELLNMITARTRHDLIIVSNEVLCEPLSEEPFTRTFQRMVGVLHNLLVQESDCAVEMEMGLPLIRKGAIV